jgi:hypothetical protein
MAFVRRGGEGPLAPSRPRPGAGSRARRPRLHRTRAQRPIAGRAATASWRSACCSTHTRTVSPFERARACAPGLPWRSPARRQPAGAPLLAEGRGAPGRRAPAASCGAGRAPSPGGTERVAPSPAPPSPAQKGRHMMKTSAQENNTPWDVLECNEAALNAMVRDLGGRERRGATGREGALEKGRGRGWAGLLRTPCVGPRGRLGTRPRLRRRARVCAVAPSP